jgi:hypothetical protein
VRTARDIRFIEVLQSPALGDQNAANARVDRVHPGRRAAELERDRDGRRPIRLGGLHGLDGGDVAISGRSVRAALGICASVGTFSAVRTTGIYCCPACSARPRRENVSGYVVAAAAEADGYRACYQCRPYRWPQTVSWTGSELVCRAVRLILDGALDGATEAELGARLGVSARHLRRLFAETLGVTPDGLAFR